MRNQLPIQFSATKTKLLSGLVLSKEEGGKSAMQKEEGWKYPLTREQVRLNTEEAPV